MEITLEKIELVKDRTGASYKEAKEALEMTDGDVIDAIIAIEEKINGGEKKQFTEYAGTVVDKLKSIINKGNVSRIVVKKNEEMILNLPVNAGIIGAIISPLVLVAGVVAAFGTKCVIEVIKEDGSIIDVSEMTKEAADNAIEKGTVIAEELKEKGATLYGAVLEKGTEAYEAVREKVGDAIDQAKPSRDDMYYDDWTCCSDKHDDNEVLDKKDEE